MAAAGAGVLASSGTRDSDDTHQVDERITTVQLAAESADITIKVSDDDKTTVQEKRTYWLWKHGDAYSVKDGVLKLDGDCGWQCRSDFVVTVPRGTKVTGDNGSGDLSISGVSGVGREVAVRQDRARRCQRRREARPHLGRRRDRRPDRQAGRTANSGDITASGLKGGPVNVQTSSGDIELELAEANDVRAKGTSSDIEVTAPSGGYNVSTETRSGDVDNELGDDPNGSHTIDASTVSGDIDLRTN